MRINRNHSVEMKDRPLTAQRRLLLDTIREAEGHLDARELYRRAMEKDPRISLATVYRNLHLFKELGLVDQRWLDEGHCYYEIKRSAEHLHLVCTACRRVIDFESSLVGNLMDEVQRNADFDVARIMLYLEGYCPECKQKQKMLSTPCVETIDTMEERVTIQQEVRKVLNRFGRRRGNLVPILQQIQARLGYLPREVMLEVAEFLEIPEIDVYSVVTFYNQFRLTPPGKHPVRVCLGTACHMKGGYIILDAWKRRLGINRGETTSDREFDLDTVACVGCCAMAPVTVVDNEVEGKVSPTRVDGILLSYQLEKDKEAKQSQ